MATAIIELNASAPATRSTASTPWWRRRDPYVLLPLVLVHSTLASPLIFRIVSAPAALLPALDELFMGFVFAQCLLLGIWAALGCLPLLVRWGLVTCAYLTALFTFAVTVRQGAPFWIFVLYNGLVGAMAITIFAALLLPFRSLLLWRLDFDPNRHSAIVGRRYQVGFMSLAAFSLAIAAPLAIVRLIVESSTDLEAHTLLFALIAFPASIGGAACPVAHAILTWRRLLLAIAAAPVWCAAVGTLHLLLSLYFPGLIFFDDDHTWPNDLSQTISFYTGIAACIIPTFAALRLAGLKLFALRHVNPAPAHPCHPRSSAATYPAVPKLPTAA